MAFSLRFPLTLGVIILAAAVAMPCLSGPSLASDGGEDVPLRPTVTGEVAVPAPSPMVIARMRAAGPCGLLCPEWIMAQGSITPVTPERLRQQLRKMGQAKLPVVLESPGGDVDAALQMGRMIRAAGLTTVIGRSEAEGCKPGDQACTATKPAGLLLRGHVSAPAQCSGACLFVLAGGSRRAGAWVTRAELAALDTFTSRRAASDTPKRIASYLADMGISTGLVVRLRGGSLALDRKDMQHFGLSTVRDRVEDLTGSSICMGARPAPNCVTLMPPPPPVILSARLKPLPPVRRSAAPIRKIPPASPPGRLIIWGALDGM